ncbi:MAG: DMT family transporter [Christensenellaceae bacterium]|nr:DMT family transporter [Christensenellaceae bacterium]
MNKQIKASLLLLLTALIWGLAFVAQSSGMEYIGPFGFNAIRSLMGAMVVLPLVLINRKKEAALPEKDRQKFPFIGGILCGLLLFSASSLQQFGMVETTAGKAGFITAMYSVLVPILGLFIGKKTRLLVWVCAALSIVGFYFLCVTESFTVSMGDFLVFLCSVFFAVHILFVDKISPHANGVEISFMQLLMMSFLSFICTILFEELHLEDILACIVPLAYAGFCSMGIAYTLQIVAQKDADPTVASLIMCLESVFAVIGSALILGEEMNTREILGSILIFGAVVLSQLPEGAFKKKKQN